MSSGESVVEVVEVDRPRRPRRVTVVVVLALLQAALFFLVGFVLLLVEPTSELQDAVELERSQLRIGGGVLVGIGVLIVALALLLARGSERARSVVGAVETVYVATAVYGLVALRDFGAQSVWALVLPVVVLWLLYGSEQVTEFFAR